MTNNAWKLIAIWRLQYDIPELEMEYGDISLPEDGIINIPEDKFIKPGETMVNLGDLETLNLPLRCYNNRRLHLHILRYLRLSKRIINDFMKHFTAADDKLSLSNVLA